MQIKDKLEEAIEQLDLQGLLILQGILLQRSLDLVQQSNKVVDQMPKKKPSGLIVPNPTIF